MVVEPSNKRQRRENEKLSKQQYHLPQPVPEELELPMDHAKEEDVEKVGESNNTPNMENTTDQLRQSRRLPRVSQNTWKA